MRDVVKKAERRAPALLHNIIISFKCTISSFHSTLNQPYLLIIVLILFLFPFYSLGKVEVWVVADFKLEPVPLAK